MTDLDILVLRRMLGSSLQSYTAHPIKKSPRSEVVRLRLQWRAGRPGPPTAILKILSPSWPEDPEGPDRERRLYESTLRRVGIRVPAIYGSTVQRETGRRLLCLEDLEPTYRFLAPRDVWTPAEVKALLDTYARLHVGGRQLIPSPAQRNWLMQPWHVGLETARLITQARELADWGIWQQIPGIEELTERTVGDVPRLSNEDPTLLHNDLYPPNVAMPHDSEGPAALIDWEMASWGQGEIDLAYLFLQPYRSADRVDRTSVLEHYWAVRASLGDEVPDAARRRERQDHADRVMALALVRVAHRVAQVPFPAGSDQAAYWTSMFCVLEERLHMLAEQLRRQR